MPNSRHRRLLRSLQQERNGCRRLRGGSSCCRVIQRHVARIKDISDGAAAAVGKSAVFVVGVAGVESSSSFETLHNATADKVSGGGDNGDGGRGGVVLQRRADSLLHLNAVVVIAAFAALVSVAVAVGGVVLVILRGGGSAAGAT